MSPGLHERMFRTLKPASCGASLHMTGPPAGTVQSRRAFGTIAPGCATPLAARSIPP